MEWGSGFWGDPFGGPAPVNADHAGTAIAKLPDVNRTPGAVAYVGTLAERWQRIDYAIANAQPYLLLDYRTSHGVWLDVIGSLLGVPRETRTDDYYRRVLAAYAQIVLPRRRTTEGLLSALVALIGSADDVVFTPSYPKGFLLELNGFGVDDLLTWDAIRIIKSATPATFNAQTLVTPSLPLKVNDASGTVSIVNPRKINDASGTIVIDDPGHVAWIYVIQ